MFDGRVYRAALVPMLLVVVIVGFSLTGATAPLRSTLAPDAFDGARAYTTLRQLLHEFPDRQPGSVGDERLAAHVAQSLRSLSGSAGGGFRVSTHSFTASTGEGRRTLADVIAVRPGSGNGRAIAIVAHRDALARGSAAELSGTAALLELARVFAQSETKRTVVLVSTSGGSDGGAGAAWLAAHLNVPLDAAIVLGDLAGTRAHTPFVLPFSGGPGTAPELLLRTVESAISEALGANPGSIGLGGQLVHLALPLATGEQAPLADAAIPAVSVQVSGLRGPTGATAIGERRLTNFGRGVLAAVYALDEGRDVDQAPGARLLLGKRSLPEWAIRMLVLALLLAPLLSAVDALARLRRRREPLAAALRWTLSAALPFAVAAIFAVALAALGILAAPSGQLSAAAIAADAGIGVASAATLLVLVGMLLAWPALVRRLGLPPRPRSDASGLVPVLVLLCVALLAWLLNPFAALLLVPAAHVCLLAAEARRRVLTAVVLAVAVVPLVLLLLAYGRELDLGPVALVQAVVLAAAGGQVSILALLLWSVTLGCLTALLVRSLGPVDQRPEPLEQVRISTRGPLTYAGPGSLGGTKSALRH